MTIGSLFSGLGGLELGLEWAGLGPVQWQVEIDPFCREVLAKHWPNARRFADVKAVGLDTLGRVDIVCGGFPCQDVSLAGKGKGLDGDRSGLWFEQLRIIEELRPSVVVAENVPGLLRRGLDVVVEGLCGLGYAVEGTRLRAGDVGAPHRRERLFIVAYARGLGRQGDGLRERRWQVETRVEGSGPGMANPDGLWQPQLGRKRLRGRPSDRGIDGDVGDDDPAGRRPLGQPQAPQGQTGGAATKRAAHEHTRSSEPGVDRVPPGVSDRLDRDRWPAGRGPEQHDWEPPRTVAPRSVVNRAKRVKALGNAVVPHCAYVVGMRIRHILQEQP